MSFTLITPSTPISLASAITFWLLAFQPHTLTHLHGRPCCARVATACTIAPRYIVERCQMTLWAPSQHDPSRDKYSKVPEASNHSLDASESRCVLSTSVSRTATCRLVKLPEAIPRVISSKTAASKLSTHKLRRRTVLQRKMTSMLDCSTLGHSTGRCSTRLPGESNTCSS